MRPAIPKGVWVLGFVSLLMDVSSELIHSLLPVFMVTGLGASALVTGFSREFEDQADRVGLRYAWEGGYDVTKGPALWQKFKTKYGETDKISNFFSGDHSRPTERIRNIQRQIDLNYKGTPPKRS